MLEISPDVCSGRWAVPKIFTSARRGLTYIPNRCVSAPNRKRSLSIPPDRITTASNSWRCERYQMIFSVTPPNHILSPRRIEDIALSAPSCRMPLCPESRPPHFMPQNPSVSFLYAPAPASIGTAAIMPASMTAPGIPVIPWLLNPVADFKPWTRVCRRPAGLRNRSISAGKTGAVDFDAVTIRGVQFITFPTW